MGIFSQLQLLLSDAPLAPRARHTSFLETPGPDGRVDSSFHNYTTHQTRGYWAVPNEKCKVHRDLWRELYGAPVGPEHYCVNQNAQKDFQASGGSQPTQKCYDLQNCQAKGGSEPKLNKTGRPTRPVLSTDPDYPNTVVFLTPDALDAAQGMK